MTEVLPKFAESKFRLFLASKYLTLGKDDKRKRGYSGQESATARQERCFYFLPDIPDRKTLFLFFASGIKVLIINTLQTNYKF